MKSVTRPGVTMSSITGTATAILLLIAAEERRRVHRVEGVLLESLRGIFRTSAWTTRVPAARRTKFLARIGEKFAAPCQLTEGEIARHTVGRPVTSTCQRSQGSNVPCRAWRITITLAGWSPRQRADHSHSQRGHVYQPTAAQLSALALLRRPHSGHNISCG
jgi:hypothetical protein